MTVLERWIQVLYFFVLQLIFARQSRKWGASVPAVVDALHKLQRMLNYFNTRLSPVCVHTGSGGIGMDIEPLLLKSLAQIPFQQKFCVIWIFC